MNEKIRLARVEAVCNQIRSEMDDVLEKAYAAACQDRDEEAAAAIARQIRNKLLENSDKQCVLDKVLPSAPSGTTFLDWLEWMRTLAGISTNPWGVYRRRLRDLPQQEGFPFRIAWPDAPDSQEIDM